MNLIAALGNPGRKYEHTKHNFGFWVGNQFASQNKLQFRAGKGQYVYAQQSGAFILVKPTTYMNDSGIAVKEASRYFDIETENILLVYDDIDLPLGTLRFRSGGGSGGHKGVDSVIYHLQSEDMPRLRLGIATDAPMRPSERYVLLPFNLESKKIVPQVVDQACKGIDHFLKYGITETMNQYNRKGTV
ncbi:MAG: aminoacyl-tRNA hydrolase [Fidelibacterota bacterium]